MKKQWEQRNCRNCKIQLGCPHSILAQCFMVEPTEDMKPIIMKDMCSKLKIREEEL